jgi:protein involved in polysaccharide export with SLBB domain
MNRAVEKHFRGFHRPGDAFWTVLASLTCNPISAITLLMLLLGVCAIGGSAQIAGNVRAPTATSERNSERIHLGDVVDVDFVGSFEFDWRGKLTNEGFLDGLERSEKPVYALCRTEAEVAAEIAERHRYFLRDPNVVVRIVDRTNRALAYVTGAVKTAQRFRLRRPVSLLELIVLSGGITDSSNGEIGIFRPPEASCSASEGTNMSVAEPKQMTIKIADLLRGDPEANPRIMIGDIVTVREAPPVFVIGDVSAPRRINLTPELTLSRAISYAGGLSRSFSGQKARIHRRNPETKLLEFDLRRIMDKKDQDPRLEPYDVVDVEQKGIDSRKIVPVYESPAMNAEARSRLPLRIVD